jgi:hypothetical protein
MIAQRMELLMGKTLSGHDSGISSSLDLRLTQFFMLMT